MDDEARVLEQRRYRQTAKGTSAARLFRRSERWPKLVSLELRLRLVGLQQRYQARSENMGSDMPCLRRIGSPRGEKQLASACAS